MMPQNWIGKSIGGRYQIEALLGQGGMSAVYRATDPNLHRMVAIKMIHTHLSSDPNFVARFKEEATAVARLRHPNIVQVHDFNLDGETYYMVMEYLVGETLQRRLKRLNATGRPMPLDEALSLCIQLCSATGYAHNHGLVHRDIKPANVMLDVHGQAILMDFGIVKIIGGDYHTATGATIGTAMYMSPEQIRSERIDERADIYSLGVTLYEMISGRPPYMADSALTLMMMVLNDPLPNLAEIREGIPGSLLAVVGKALAKKTVDRFQNMTEMESALQQVQAELTSTPPAPITTMIDESVIEPTVAPVIPVTVTDALPVEEIDGTSQVRQSEAASPSADLQQLTMKTASVPTQLDVSLGTAPTRPTPNTPWAWLSARLSSRGFLLVAVGLVFLAVTLAIVLLFLNTRKPPGVTLVPINRPADSVNAQTARMVVNLGSWDIDSYIEELTYSPDGNLLGTANNREWVRSSRYRFFNGLWHVQNGSLQNYLLGHTQWVYDVAFSPDGQLFGSASDDGNVMLWQTDNGSLVRKIHSEEGGLTSLVFSPNNLLIAAGTWDGTVSLWEISTGNLLRTLQGHEISLKDVDFSPDGILLAAASDDNTILLWRVSDGNLIQTLQGHTAPVHKVVFSPDGSLLASGSDDYTIKIWQVSDGSVLRDMPGHTEAIYDVSFSPDGSLLASGSGDCTLRLWQVSDGALLSTLAGNSDSIKTVAFSPDGYLLVSGAADGTVLFWGISEAIPIDNK